MQLIPEVMPMVLLAIPFLVASAVLQFVLLRPLQTYLDERKAVTETAFREADAFAEKAKARMEDLEKRLREGRSNAANVRAEARSAAQKREAAILADARSRAEADIDRAAAQIADAAKAASTTLATTARDLSEDIARTLLGGRK